MCLKRATRMHALELNPTLQASRPISNTNSEGFPHTFNKTSGLNIRPPPKKRIHVLSLHSPPQLKNRQLMGEHNDTLDTV